MTFEHIKALQNIAPIPGGDIEVYNAHPPALLRVGQLLVSSLTSGTDAHRNL
jgi:hypothetical protein